MHRVFIVCQLKQARGGTIHSFPTFLPQLPDDFEFIVEPTAVLEARHERKQKSQEMEVLEGPPFLNLRGRSLMQSEVS